MSDRAKTVVFILVVFLSGVVSGALLQNLGEHYWLHRGRHLPINRDWEAAERGSMIQRLQAELRLTDAQTKRLEAILDQTLRQYHDLHSFTEHIRREGIKQIRDMLEPGQRVRFDEILEHSRKKVAASKRERRPR